jgi:hypothetical protein
MTYNKFVNKVGAWLFWGISSSSSSFSFSASVGSASFDALPPPTASLCHELFLYNILSTDEPQTSNLVNFSKSFSEYNVIDSYDLLTVLYL